MKIIFNYDPELGDVSIDPSSVDYISELYAESTIGALDLLSDMHGIIAQEYDEALNGHFSMFSNRINGLSD